MNTLNGGRDDLKRYLYATVLLFQMSFYPITCFLSYSYIFIVFQLCKLTLYIPCLHIRQDKGGKKILHSTVDLNSKNPAHGMKNVQVL